MNLSRLVAYNTLVQISAKIITLVFGVTTTILLTNYLGSSGFGDYIFALSYTAIFSGIADWGTTLISIRDAVRNQDQEGRFLGNVIILRLLLSLLAILIAWLVIIFFPALVHHSQQLQRLALLSSTLILLFALKNSLEIIFQAKLKMDRMAMTELAASLFTLAFSFLSIKFSGGIFLLIHAIILANLLSIALAFFLASPLVSLNFNFSRPILTRIIYEALPMGGVLAVYSLYNKVDLVILQAFKGSGAVGVYGLSYRIYEVLILGAFYFMNSLFPLMAKEKNKEKFLKIYQKTLDLLIIGGIIVFLGTLVFAPLAIKIISFKKAMEFSQSMPLLRILGLAAFVSFLNHLTGYTIVTLNKQKKYLLIGFCALVFNLSANIILIPRFSFYAAAWITVLTETLVFFLTSILVAKNLHFVPSFLSFPQTAIRMIRERKLIFE